MINNKWLWVALGGAAIAYVAKQVMGNLQQTSATGDKVQSTDNPSQETLSSNQQETTSARKNKQNKNTPAFEGL